MRSSGESNHTSVHFFEVEYTTAVKALPHSRQLALSRDVINPQCGHILCNPDPAASGFILRLRPSSTIMNNTISKPRKAPVAFIRSDPSGQVLRRPSQSWSRVLTLRSRIDFAK